MSLQETLESPTRETKIKATLTLSVEKYILAVRYLRLIGIPIHGKSHAIDTILSYALAGMKADPQFDYSLPRVTEVLVELDPTGTLGEKARASLIAIATSGSSERDRNLVEFERAINEHLEKEEALECPNQPPPTNS